MYTYINIYVYIYTYIDKSCLTPVIGDRNQAIQVNRFAYVIHN